jgi:uroporphyrinogen-III synthase
VAAVADRRDAAGLLDEVRRVLPPAGRRFLLPRAAGARDVLPDGLRAGGATVDAVAAYRTLAAPVDGESLRRMLSAGELDVLTFASPSAVASFDRLLDDAARAAARRCVVASIGPVTAEALRGVGLAPEVAPARAGAEDLVAALSERFGEPSPARGGTAREGGER